MNVAVAILQLVILCLITLTTSFLHTKGTTMLIAVTVQWVIMGRGGTIIAIIQTWTEDTT